jgi:predicted PurR-regulated permease PerM
MAIQAEDSVVPAIRKAAAWAWRLLVVFVAVAVAFRLIMKFQVIFLPLAIALIMSALLLPAVDRLNAWGFPRVVAVAVVLVGFLLVVGGAVAFVVSRVVDGIPGLVDQISISIESLRRWLTEGPMQLSARQVSDIGDSAIAALREHQTRVTGALLITANTLTSLVTGLFIGIFALACFLSNGARIYRFVTNVVPASVRPRVRAAGRAGYGALGGYVRATLFVAFVDAVGIGAGLVVMGIPLAFPLAVLVFLGAFVPLVGAVVTGLLAVLVALLAKGWVFGLLTLALVIVVQQVEGNVLQPLVVGHWVSLHPLAVLTVLTAGGIIAGVGGVLLAVPALAFADRAIRDLVTVEVDPTRTVDGDGPG